MKERREKKRRKGRRKDGRTEGRSQKVARIQERQPLGKQGRFGRALGSPMLNRKSKSLKTKMITISPKKLAKYDGVHNKLIMRYKQPDVLEP